MAQTSEVVWSAAPLQYPYRFSYSYCNTCFVLTTRFKPIHLLPKHFKYSIQEINKFIQYMNIVTLHQRTKLESVRQGSIVFWNTLLPKMPNYLVVTLYNNMIFITHNTDSHLLHSLSSLGTFWYLPLMIGNLLLLALSFVNTILDLVLNLVKYSSIL